MSRRPSATVSTKFTDARRVLCARGYTLREPVPGRKAGGLVDLVFTNRAQVSFAGLRPRQVVNHLEGAECLSRKDELCDILRGAFSDGALDAFVPRCFNARDPAQLRAFLCTFAFLASSGSSTDAVQAQCDAGESSTGGGERPNSGNGVNSGNEFGANGAEEGGAACGGGTEGAVDTESASTCTLRAKFENTLAAAEGLVAACQTVSITEEEWNTVLSQLAPVDMAPGGVVDGRPTGAASAVVVSVKADNAAVVGSALDPGRTPSNACGPCDADGEQKSSSPLSVSLSSTSATASATLKPSERQSALAWAAGASGTGGTTDVQRRLMRSNCWILKPAAQSCGQGIVCSTDLGHLLRRAAALRFQCVLQKYIENPLLLHGRKFDIRVWVVILSVDPLDVRMFTPCYLRLTSSQYSTDWDDPFAHLCNFSIQKEYTGHHTGAGGGAESPGGGTRADDAKRPMDMWTSDKFRSHLQREYGGRDMWSEKVLPAMRHIVTCSLQAALATGRIKRRGLGFEWLGYDIMLDDALNAFLIEINTSPDMSHSTPVTATLVPRATETLVDIVLGESVDDADDSDIADEGATRAEAADCIMEWVQMDLDLDAGTAGPTNIPPVAIDCVVGEGEDAHSSRQHPARVVGEMFSSSTCERLGLACPMDDDCFQLSVAATAASFSLALPPTTLAHIVAVRGNVPPKALRSAAARVSPRLRPHDTTVGGGGCGGAVATVRLPILFDPRQLECVDRGLVVASAGTADDMDSTKTDDDNTLLATWAVLHGLGTGARVAVVNVSESCCGAVTDEGNKGEGVGTRGASGGECQYALNDTVSRALAALPSGTAVVVVARSSVTVNTSVADALGDRNARHESESWRCELARADTSAQTTFQLNLTRQSV